MKPRRAPLNALVTVRELQPTDSIEQLTALLHRAYAELGAMGLNFTAVSQSTEITAERVHLGKCFVACKDASIVATVVVQPSSSSSKVQHFAKPGVAKANQLAVEPHFQGQGIASALLSHAKDWAREQGFAELALDTAEPAKHLIEFYAKRGYRQVGCIHWPSKAYHSVVLSKALAQGA